MSRAGHSVGRWAGSAVACLLAVALSGCGGSPAAIRVGSTAVSPATVKHWSSIAQAEGAGSRTAAKQQALAFLIFSHWLLGEASKRHLAPTQAQVARRLEATRAVLIGGSESSYIRKLKASKRTAADLRFEIETELAYLHIREAVLAAGSAVSAAEIDAYFQSHRSSFIVSERRYFDIAEFRTDAAARKLKAEVEAGRKLAPVALHENIVREAAFKEEQGKIPIERALLTAKIGELRGPYVIEPYKLHSIFIVRRIVPPRPKTLAEAKEAVEQIVRKRNQQMALASFNASWRSHWLASTDCETGYVVGRCKQFRGAREPAGTFAIETTGLGAAERPSLAG